MAFTGMCFESQFLVFLATNKWEILLVNFLATNKFLATSFFTFCIYKTSEVLVGVCLWSLNAWTDAMVLEFLLVWFSHHLHIQYDSPTLLHQFSDFVPVSHHISTSRFENDIYFNLQRYVYTSSILFGK